MIKVDRAEVDEISVSLLECCGVEEIDGLVSHAPTVVAAVQLKSLHRAYVIFTDNHLRDYGKSLHRTITRNGLGSVYKVPPRKNPGSSNIVTLWVWAPDWRAVGKYYEENIKIVSYS